MNLYFANFQISVKDPPAKIWQIFKKKLKISQIFQIKKKEQKIFKSRFRKYRMFRPPGRHKLTQDHVIPNPLNAAKCQQSFFPTSSPNEHKKITGRSIPPAIPKIHFKFRISS